MKIIQGNPAIKAAKNRMLPKKQKSMDCLVRVSPKLHALFVRKGISIMLECAHHETVGVDMRKFCTATPGEKLLKQALKVYCEISDSPIIVSRNLCDKTYYYVLSLRSNLRQYFYMWPQGEFRSVIAQIAEPL